MAFTIANWTCVSASLNQGQINVTPFGGSATELNAPNLFIYSSATDTLATISAANYFLSMYASLRFNDVIIVHGTDGSNMYIVSTSSAAGVAVTSFTASGSVATANIQNNAVTFAKIQEIATVTLLGNPTGGTTEVSEVTLGNGLEFSSTTLRIPLTTMRYTSVAVSSAEFKGMYAAPKLLVAAGGANTLQVLEECMLLMTYATTAYAAGGVAHVQYDSTANGAGVIASTTMPAADLQTTVSAGFPFNAGNGPLPFSTTVNKGLYLSNITGAFTTGDSTFVAHVWYRTIATA